MKMPGKSEKMTGVGGMIASGAKGVWVAGASGSVGVSGVSVPQAESIIEKVRTIKLNFLIPNPYCVLILSTFYFPASAISNENSLRSVSSTGISSRKSFGSSSSASG